MFVISSKFIRQNEKNRPCKQAFTNPAFWLEWATRALSVVDRPLVAKGIDFQIENNGRKLTFSRGFFKMIFCPTTTWFILL